MKASYQDFETGAGTAQTPARVGAVRALMAAAGLDAFLVPRADQFQGEYVPPSAERLRWLTGFSGSAGLAVLGRRGAGLFVDGRYTIQARDQVDTSIFEILQAPDQKLSDWLAKHLPKGGAVGFDPWLHTAAGVEELGKTLKAKGIALKPVRRNLVDRAWGKARPTSPNGAVIVHPLKHAGTAAADKIARLQKQLKEDGQDAVVLTLPDSVCWLFNIRGSDVAHNPVVLAFAIVPAGGKAELFVDATKIAGDAEDHLAPLARILEPGELASRVRALREKGKRVRVDAGTAAAAIWRMLGKSAVRGADPCIEPKAIKCAAEIKGARAAHVRDGVAVCRFLAWLDASASDGGIDEITAVRELERCRRASPMLREISFDTISGSGPNGAIVHYRVTTSTNRRLKAGELFLIDSGAQYADGTTDITRTVAIGKPGVEMRERYTAVLKGHVAISMARFPKGTRGVDLDPLARRPLWQLGLDYDHGTGHGVGSYLSVHEGPASISRRGMVELKPGMILSNEPGYYKTGAYGIRIENLVLVAPPELPEGGERPVMDLETLTLVPYDRSLIDVRALSPAERAWIDAYHVRVRDAVSPQLDGSALDWLKGATAPLS